MPSILLVEQGNAHWCIIVGYILPRRYIAGYIAAFSCLITLIPVCYTGIAPLVLK